MLGEGQTAAMAGQPGAVGFAQRRIFERRGVLQGKLERL